MSTVPQPFNVNVFPQGEKQFSPARYALAVTTAKRTGMGYAQAMKRYAPYEWGWLEAKYAKGQVTMLDYLNNREVKAQDVFIGQDGGYLTPETWGKEFWSALRSHSVLGQAGALHLPMDARLSHESRLTVDFTEYYVPDNTAITASTLTFAQSNWQPRKQAVTVTLSREFVRDSAPTVDALLNSEAMKFMAMRRDYQALLGDGTSGTPVGVLNMSQINPTFTTSLGATPTYANLVTGVGNVLKLNGTSNAPTGQADCTAVIGATQLLTAMLSMLDSNNRPLWTNGVAGALNVQNWLFTNVIPLGNTASIFYGHWPSLIIRHRPDVEFSVVTEEESFFTKDQVGMRFIVRYDVAAVHPEAFFVHTNAHA